MKKILFCLLCYFLFICCVFASNIKSQNLPYYVLINNEVIQVKKIYNKDTLEVLFNIDYKNYDTDSDFTKYSEYKHSIWSKYELFVNKFKTIVYYGYNENPSDLNYYLTQIMVWRVVGFYGVSIVDQNGNQIKGFNDKMNELVIKYDWHTRLPSFANNTYDIKIWDTLNFKYLLVVLDNPINDNIDIYNNDLDLSIYAKNVSDNKLLFSKYYDNKTYCYSDGTNIYWQSIGGPSNIEASMNLNISGIKFKLKENLIGINNRVGDATLNSTYELYLNDELKTTFNSEEEIYVKSNSNYVLKDISSSPSTINIEDLYFEIKNKEYLLNIDKYVITKNISLEILDDKTYYVYLKSNNELYEIINKNNDLITLPYGTYYITDKDKYYEELVVNNSVDELYTINNIEVKEEVVGDKIEEETNDSHVVIEEIENPTTIDNIYIYIISFILSLLLTCFDIKFIYNAYTK